MNVGLTQKITLERYSDGGGKRDPYGNGKLLKTFKVVKDMSEKSSWLPLDQEWASSLRNPSRLMTEFNYKSSPNTGQGFHGTQVLAV